MRPGIRNIFGNKFSYRVRTSSFLHFMSKTPNYQKSRKKAIDSTGQLKLWTVTVPFKCSIPLIIQSATTKNPNPISTHLPSPNSTSCHPLSEFVSWFIFKIVTHKTSPLLSLHFSNLPNPLSFVILYSKKRSFICRNRVSS
jgi:hypothetical protein